MLFVFLLLLFNVFSCLCLNKPPLFIYKMLEHFFSISFFSIALLSSSSSHSSIYIVSIAPSFNCCCCCCLFQLVAIRARQKFVIYKTKLMTSQEPRGGCHKGVKWGLWEVYIYIQIYICIYVCIC